MVEKYKDFAFSDYARVGRALALYEVGDRDEAIAEMEDVSISLKGYPGISKFLKYVRRNNFGQFFFKYSNVCWVNLQKFMLL